MAICCPAPPVDCNECDRLVDFRTKNQDRFPSYFNGAVPPFGDLNAELLVVGLAPGLHGANQTKRPFTGDYAGDLLYPTLKQFGWATGDYGARPDDGFMLKNARVTNAVRCVPPENKPTTAEIKQCNPFLAKELAAMPNLKIVLALGTVAHQAMLRSQGLKVAYCKFAHNTVHKLPNLTMINSYHCSRYNTSTKRLTTEMFHDVFRTIEDLLHAPTP